MSYTLSHLAEELKLSRRNCLVAGERVSVAAKRTDILNTRKQSLISIRNVYSLTSTADDEAQSHRKITSRYT